MESTALSVGKSVLGGVLGYAGSALAEEVALQLGVQLDHSFIRDELEMMQAFLMAADEEGDGNKVVLAWVNQVRDVAYDVEYCLQDFAVRLEKSSWRRVPRTLLDRRRVAKRMKEPKVKVEHVSQRNLRYHLIKGHVSKPITGDMRTTIATATSSTVASGSNEGRSQRDSAKVDLIGLINKKDDNLRVIAVWGTSGNLGETSVIKRAFEDAKIQKKFECKAWVKVMRPFNPIEFLQSIIRQLYANYLQEQGESGKYALWTQVLKRMKKEDNLADDFKGYMSETRYLIVINEISTIEEWDHIRAYFPNNKKGCRIILSTEQVEVASLCVGTENAPPGHIQLSADRTLYAFYREGSQNETDSTEVGFSSNAAIDGSDISSDRKVLTRVGTMAAAFKESQLIGQHREKSDIIKLITSEDSQQLEVISVCGMGGIGKTWLVRDVYQSQEISAKFEKRAFILAMAPFIRDEVLKSLSMQFGLEDVTELTKHLEEKKYLIVFDDLSSTRGWDDVISYFPATVTGSRIIVTTRKRRIAEHCSKDVNIYILGGLSPDDARDLFTKKVFGKIIDLDEQYPELVDQAELLLKHCRGVPLAIVNIGGFLANQPKTSLEWRKLNKFVSAELEMNPDIEAIRGVLNKSFDGLPYDLKYCFLYMCIFSEDQVVSRRRLVHHWTAAGYSRELSGKSAEEIAESYFMELINRSMILPSQQSIHSLKEIDSCQVHDLIRDIAITKSREENLVLRLEEGCNLNRKETSHHLSISSNWEGDQDDFESIVDLSHVRSITVFGHCRPFYITGKMRLLRVLDLADTSGLLDHHLGHIGNYIHLTYLSLRGCDGIYHLPSSVGNLWQLETLDVRGTRILKLPKSIINFRKLNYLRAGCKLKEDISHEGIVEEFPPVTRNRLCAFICCHALSTAMATRLVMHGVVVPSGLGNLKSLHTLGVVNIARGKDILHDMKRLIWLRKLGVTGIHKRNSQEFCSTIASLRRIESLSVWLEGNTGLSAILDGMPTLPEKLQSLKLYGNLVKLPEWIKGLKNLVKLKLQSSKILEHDTAMQALGHLPNLSILCLWKDSFQGEEVRINFQRGAFPSLVVLELDALDNLKSVNFERGATPKLELLQYRGVAGFVGLFSGLASLTSLKEVLLTVECSQEFMEYLREQLARNPNQPVLKVSELQS